MKVHVFGAIFGTVCAIAFLVAPFVAGADAGPSHVVAPVHAPAPVEANPVKPVKRHMHRGGIERRDDGCGS